MPSSSTNKRNLFLRISYQGTHYAGWQSQRNAVAVQNKLAQALRQLYSMETCELFGCSRTDSGVHALDQCITFRPPVHPPIPESALQKALNGRLPADIRVLSVVEMPPGFHARHDNCGKAYTYLIHRGPLQTPFLSNFLWEYTWDLNLDLMRDAAARLVGEHDFAAFTVALQRQDVRNSIRELNRFEFREYGNVLAVTVVGGSFLYKMVRRLIGFLVEVGRGRHQPELADQLLCESEPGDFKTAPGNGLFLERVFFDKAELLAFQSTNLPFMQLCNLA